MTNNFVVEIGNKINIWKGAMVQRWGKVIKVCYLNHFWGLELGQIFEAFEGVNTLSGQCMAGKRWLPRFPLGA